MRWHDSLSPLAIFALLLPAGSPASTRSTDPAPAPPGLTLGFEENRGQLPEGVRFGARGERFRLLLSPDSAAVLTQEGRAREGGASRVELRVVGANASPEVVGEQELEGRLHYARGADPSHWVNDVRRYARVRYREVLPGVDLVYHESQRQLEYDFVVAPGADPEGIAMQFDGADAVAVTADGQLVVRGGETELRLEAPLLYQTDDTGRREVPGAYVVAADRSVGFRIGDYDREEPLVIDPVVLGYSARFGGSARDELRDMAVDPSGNIYLTGFTQSDDFQGSARVPVGDDVFVVKLGPNGTSLVYAVFLVGDGNDDAWGIAADATGNAYVAGHTSSTDFPRVNAFDDTLSGGEDAFFTKLDPSGTIVYSTYYGGSDLDGRFDGGIAVHSSGRVYVAGRSESLDLPPLNAFQAGCVAPGCAPPVAWVAGFDPSLSGPASHIYGSYLAGDGDNGALAIDVDAAEDVYVFGFTGPANSLVAPGQGFQDSTGDVSNRDHFLVKLDLSQVGTNQRIYSTFIGGTGDEDEGGDIHVGNGGVVTVVGATDSDGSFPTKNALQASNGGAQDGYVLQADTTLVGLASQAWGTFLGAGLGERADGVTVDGSGNVWVGLNVNSAPTAGFPLEDPIPNLAPPSASQSSAMVVQLSSDGQTRLLATPTPPALRLATGPFGRIYLAGGRNDPGFPQVNAPTPGPIGGFEVSIARLDPFADTGLSLTATDSVDPAATGDTFAVRYLVTNHGVEPATDIEVTSDFPAAGLSVVNTSANCSFPGTTSVCDFFEPLPVGANAPVYLQVSGPAAGSFTLNGSVLATQVDPFPADNADSESVTVSVGGSAPNALRIADFDVVANSFDIGGFALDTASGVLASPNGTLDETVNFMVFDGTIPLHIIEILGQGEVAFGLVERNTWTPTSGDGSDLFGRDFNGAADRVFAVVNALGQIEVWSARPFSEGVRVAVGAADLSRQAEFSLVLDKLTPLVQVLYDGQVVAQGDPAPSSSTEDANLNLVGDDQVISVGFGTEQRGSATLSVLPEPGATTLLGSGVLGLIALGRARSRRGRRRSA